MPTPVVVLIHGRTVPGPVVFDLQDPTPNLNLSVQNALAWASIDTFAPSLLGYGRSTRFDEGLNDPGNASLRRILQAPDASCCPYPEGCDRTLIEAINPYDQQAMLLPTGPNLPGNPLVERRRHSSNFRFARTDVWVRDIDQVIADAIKKNLTTYRVPNPDGGMVTLVGYSLGGRNVGRTLYSDNQNEQLLYADDRLNEDDDLDEDLHDRDEVIKKVKRVVFVNSFFGLRRGDQGELIGIEPTEEPDPFIPPTFPMTLDNRDASDALWRPFNADETTRCKGRIIEGTKQKVWDQTMENDTVGRT